MDTYYSLLDIAVGATTDEIAEAYRRQKERYSSERVTALGPEFEQVARERNVELERAFSILSDPHQRTSYDQSIGVRAPDVSPPAGKPGLSRREVGMAIGGGIVGLLIIAVVWVLAGRTTQPSLPPVAKVDAPAPDFTLTDINGRPVSLSDFRGKTVMINFWWTGCEPCKEETPALQAAHQKLSDQGLVILGVNVRENERTGERGDTDVKNFVSNYNVTYPVVFDREGTAGRDYQVYILPTTIFIDRDGIMRYKVFRDVKTEEVERIFMDLQQEATARR
jgi:peroxiredoxin